MKCPSIDGRSSSAEARVLAACVPFLNFLRLLSVGTGLLEDGGLVLSVSRSGDRSELLKVSISLSIMCESGTSRISSNHRELWRLL